jgi:two-component system sensor histidine kinase/response regulator
MPGVSEVPFVFVTARSGRESLREGMALGADDYITKPYSLADILGAIQARTKRHHGLREKLQGLTAQHQQEVHAQWSHELLTPLNAVLSSLDLLESEADTISRAELKEFLGFIRSGAERQERLARKLIGYFNLAQLVNAPVPATSGRCDVATAITARARQGVHLRKRTADLMISLDPGEVALTEEWLTLAINEVVENAATFSANGTPITVTGVRREADYLITITDQGRGLTSDQIAKIGAFTQFDRRVHEQQGLGLGLAIARLATQLAGGGLGLKSGVGGKGLAVELRLPFTVRAAT